MAWTQVGSTPAFGTLRNAGGIFVGDAFINSRQQSLPSIAIPQMRSLASWYQIQDGIIGFPLSGAEPSGEIAFTGGGGSVRPSSGFLYPRGDN